MDRIDHFPGFAARGFDADGEIANRRIPDQIPRRFRLKFAYINQCQLVDVFGAAFHGDLPLAKCKLNAERNSVYNYVMLCNAKKQGFLRDSTFS